MIGMNFEESIKYESQLFGLCSHAKYSPKYLTKVFLEEVKESYKNVRNDYLHFITIIANDLDPSRYSYKCFRRLYR